MPLGARIITSGTTSHKTDALIALSGPAANLIAFVPSMLTGSVFGRPYFLYFAFANLFLMMINLLPVSNNDGQVAILALLENKTYGYESIGKTEKILNKISSSVFLLFSLCAIYLSNFNPGILCLTAAANIYKKD